MSGKAGREPGRWVWKLIRGGDLERGVCVMPGKARGRCLDPGCTWPGPFGDTPHNIGRSLFRHTRTAGHRTRIAVVELTEYRPRESGAAPGRPGPSSQRENGSGTLQV